MFPLSDTSQVFLPVSLELEIKTRRDPEDQSYPKSPSIPSTAISSSTQMETRIIGSTGFSPTEPVTSPSLPPPEMVSRKFASSLSMEAIPFSDSPLMEFETFSTINPSSESELFDFSVNPAGEETGPVTGGEGEENTTGDMPQPLECLLGNPIPPFLSKTFDLVNDTSLDPIISWGSTGQSFVVWNPVEFGRVILPRNFKHNNFASFVRQLNTYGFRKIDTDRWEFANEAFQRGKRYLLNNIQRRRPSQSQQVGSYIGLAAEAGNYGLEGEVERLRKERSMMMQEVVELQQQHHGTVHHMEAVNLRLQTVEQRQKQMFSFLAKLLQNPAFVAHLKQRKEQGEISSPRVRRKFFKQLQPELGQLESSSMEGQIIKYQPDWRNISISPDAPELNPVPVEQSPDYISQGTIGMGLGAERMPYPIEIVASDELMISEELAGAGRSFKNAEQVQEGASSLGVEDPHFKGKNVISQRKDVNRDCIVSFPENLVKEKDFLELSSPVIESVAEQEMWSMGFDTSVGVSSSSNELWGLVNYNVPELGEMVGFSDVWDLGSEQVEGTSGFEKMSIPFDEPRSPAGLSGEDKPKKTNP